jgi:probable HAF family extracellular repeat protein
MQNLGTLPGYDRSYAYGVSADGAVVVGGAYNAAGQERAFRWTASGGMQNLGTLGGDRSYANGVSADGSVVVGSAQNAAERYRAFRWTAAGGMEDLNTTYASLLTNGSVLVEARAISPDGRYIVGWGGNAGQIASKPSCWIRASRGAGMSTATAVWTTPICCACYSSLAGMATATKTSTGTASVDDADLLHCAVPLRWWVLIPLTGRVRRRTGIMVPP